MSVDPKTTVTDLLLGGWFRVYGPLSQEWMHTSRPGRYSFDEACSRYNKEVRYQGAFKRPDTGEEKTVDELKLGDRVRVNDTCAYQEARGEEGFVAGLRVEPDLSVKVWLSDTWPPRGGDRNDWSPSDLNRVNP